MSSFFSSYQRKGNSFKLIVLKPVRQVSEGVKVSEILLTGLFQQAMQRRFDSGQNINTHLFELTPLARKREHYISGEDTNNEHKQGEASVVGLPVHVCRYVDVVHEALNVQGQVRGVGAHQFLQFLTLLVEPDQSPGLGLHIQFVLLPKFFAEMLHQDFVEVLSSQQLIAGRGEDLRGGEMFVRIN